MHDRKSIYALNKQDSQAIVYKEKNERTVRITAKDFEESRCFEALKTWSDKDYHLEENKDHVEDNHTVSLDALPENCAYVDGAEMIFEKLESEEERSALIRNQIAIIRENLTEKQFRRLWLYYGCGLKQEEIAALENVGQRRVSASISAATKKVFKIFAKEGKK